MFHVGQKVVCTSRTNGLWHSDIDGTKFSGPDKGDIVTISGVFFDPSGTCLSFFEYPIDNEGFLYIYFRPIETTYTESEIESVDISEITQEEVITV